REVFGHFVGQLPRIALDARDQFRPDALESLNGIDVVEADSGRQSWRDVLDQAACEFFQHSQLGNGSHDGFAFRRPIGFEAIDEFVPIQSELIEPVVQIEEDPVLAPLQQVALLGAEQLTGHKGHGLGLGGRHCRAIRGRGLLGFLLFSPIWPIWTPSLLPQIRSAGCFA
ncbi:MAG: hypothetical protein M0T83_00020, partial [Nitrospiraceae bacterium]|nr:hypothetical protein [Nitrospiraceae bacterium]